MQRPLQHPPCMPGREQVARHACSLQLQLCFWVARERRVLVRWRGRWLPFCARVRQFRRRVRRPACAQKAPGAWRACVRLRQPTAGGACSPPRQAPNGTPAAYAAPTTTGLAMCAASGTIECMRPSPAHSWPAGTRAQTQTRLAAIRAAEHSCWESLPRHVQRARSGRTVHSRQARRHPVPAAMHVVGAALRSVGALACVRTYACVRVRLGGSVGAPARLGGCLR